MRLKSIKTTVLACLLLATSVAAGITWTPAGSQVRYALNDEAVARGYVLGLQGVTSSQQLLEVPQVGYIIGGSSTENGYTLNIQATGLQALTGRIALAFDTEKLALSGPDSLDAFRAAPGITKVEEVRPVDQMVSSQGGYTSLAWTSTGLDAISSPKTVATLDFVFKGGFGPEDVDVSTFRLRPIEAGDLDPFRSAASFQGKGPDIYPITYEYMTEKEACGVTFAYEGADRAPQDSKTITFRCRNNLDQTVDGVLELDGKAYATENGSVSVSLGRGEYLWRLQCDGYGAWSDHLTVTEDDTVDLCFYSNQSLVDQAAAELAIGYQPGDSADRVTQPLTLPVYLKESGVNVSWESSVPEYLSHEGLVYRPETEDVSATLKATLTRGDATATTSFDVCVKAAPVQHSEVKEDPPAAEETPTKDTESKPEKTLPNFTDLAKYDWAKDAIYQLAEEGVILGTSDTTYTPGANIRRADFILLLDRLLGLESDGTAKAFTDVPKGSYYYEAVHTARALDIAQGDGDKFHPEEPITRQDMITLTMRAIAATGYLPDTDVHASLTAFLDSEDVADYARDSMEAAVGQKFIIGDQDLLDPLGYTTRAQAAVFVARIQNAHNG